MKYLLPLLLVFVSLHSIAQDRTFSGRVMDKDKKEGIPFCVVKVKDRNEGVYTDEDGRFTFTANPDSAKAFVFVSLGYGKREIAADQFRNEALIVELQKESTSLKEVVVKAENGKVRHKNLGKKKLKHITDCYQKYGEEDAMFLYASKMTNNTRLKEICVYITNEGEPTTKFRIHVYERDPATNLPGKELTDSNLIVHANKGNEWVKADLSSKRIPVAGGVFVSVEWIAGHGNNDVALTSRKHADVKDHNGQVLGLAKNYGVPFLCHRSSFHTEWKSALESGLNPTYCPMIYGNYTYTKR